jgi:hypothetical protein
MPTVEHQWLLLWALRKMNYDGFIVAACDGPMPQGGIWNALRASWKAGAFRPDASGLSRDGRIAIGEAKTAADIDNEHTRAQLRVFGSVAGENPSRGRLYLSVPRSAAWRLDRVLASLGLAGASHVVRLQVPDCMISEAGL